MDLRGLAGLALIRVCATVLFGIATTGSDKGSAAFAAAGLLWALGDAYLKCFPTLSK